MKEDGPNPPRPATKRSHPPSRKLSLPSRVRGTFRRGADRVLGADLLWSVTFVVVVSLVLSGQQCGGDLDYREGEIARQDIVAPTDLQIRDTEATEVSREQALASARDVYVYDASRSRDAANEIKQLFADGRLELSAATDQGGEERRQAIHQKLGSRVEGSVLDVLIARGFDAGLEGDLQAALLSQMGGMIIGSGSALDPSDEIVLITLRDDTRTEQVAGFDKFRDVEEAREATRIRVREKLELGPSEEKALADMVADLVVATVQMDFEQTAERANRAEESVRDRFYTASRGEVIVRKGDKVPAEVAEALAELEDAQANELQPSNVLALAFVSGALAFFLYRYTRYHQRRFRKIEHLHALLVLMMLTMVALTWALLWLAGAVADDLKSPFGQLGFYRYLIPLGAGSVLVALLANGRIATVYSAFVSLIFGAMNGWDAYLMVWAMIVQCAGVYAISTYRDRAASLRAGLVVGVAGALAVVAIETLLGQLGRGTLYAGGLAFVGGAVGVGLLVSFLLPLFEGLFNVLTDIRLLELSNTNHPLLAQLALKAPGSYSHSLVVGTLAEEAAKAIGANTLFCRVAALYHDIGKVNKPEYYVENQRGANPHDRLSPSMSALIIAAHVKDGMKMAREARLPDSLIDIIPQHHGTRLMTYFYEKAKSSADPSLGPVKEEDFRYPGPKPQTREAAIFMLADGVEAAARTVDDPTPNRLKDMIRAVCDRIVLDRQLDACDLTFADLERIQDAFLRVLVSMHHHRVDYPGFDFNRPKTDELAARRAARGS